MRWIATLLIAVMSIGSGPVMAQEAGGRKYLSIDYQEFPTFGAAVRNSFAPTDLRANAGAVLRNTVDPLNPARYVAAVVLVDLQRQLASGQGIDVGKTLSSLSPAGIAAGYLGGQAGELMGAGVQSILANVAGPIGGFLGFASRPVLWYLGSTVGQDLGKGIRKGELSPSKAMAHALRDFNAVKDSSQMIGDSIGAVIGQALIPIPLVGAMVGGAIGGTVGLLAGSAIVKTDTGKAIDDAIRRKLDNLARSLEPTGPRYLGPPVPAPGGSPAAAAQEGAAAPAAPSDTAAPGAAAVQKASTPAGAAAYKRLLEALKSGDREQIRKAHEAIRQPAAGN